ncbi:hypothetical protein [Micromonospora rubida]|uniref:hypothetical protein n=1 Tax=Micromonospora rubida TaxID=2697657 RepID=UPI001376B51A|nr:hypothetical protein [Micromonospora rubida]NBE81215.1 hypothetical protein [Micromonospora rubida]
MNRAELCHAVLMGRLLKVIFSSLMVVAGLVGSMMFLTGQGLDRAEKWVSIMGMFVSVALSGAGITLGWWSWRQATRVNAGERVRGASARFTGDAVAEGLGSRAISGVVSSGLVSAEVIASQTGRAHASNGGVAVSGVEVSS